MGSCRQDPFLGVFVLAYTGGSETISLSEQALSLLKRPDVLVQAPRDNVAG